MKQRWYWLLSLIFFLPLTTAQADHIEVGFPSLDSASFHAFIKDFGATAAGGSFHDGKILGFPLGFDVGVHVPIVRVKDEDKVVRTDGGKNLTGEFVQAEVGLPARINLIVRGGKVETANVYGGGLRFGIFNSVAPGLPDLSLTGLYTRATHTDFTSNTISGNLVLSFDIPFVHPYIGGGFDHTNMKVEDNSNLPAAIRGMKDSASGTRVEAGLNLSVFPFTYLTLAGGLANGQSMYHAGAGVRF